MSGDRDQTRAVRIGAFLALASAIAFTLGVVGSFVGLPAVAVYVVMALGVVGAGVLVFRGPGASAIESNSQGGPSSE